MMGRYIPPVRVSVTAEQAFRAFRAAAPGLSHEGTTIITAQTHGVEAGGGSSIRNYNMGGAKAKIGGDKDWTFFATRDPAGPGNPAIILHPAPSPARQQTLREANQATWSEKVTCFRAFESLEAAALDHVEMLHFKFTRAWDEVTKPHPDPTRFAFALKEQGYYAADPNAYAKHLRYWYNKYLGPSGAWL
jgi:hypothetical protein